MFEIDQLHFWHWQFYSDCLQMRYVHRSYQGDLTVWIMIPKVNGQGVKDQGHIPLDIYASNFGSCNEIVFKPGMYIEALKGISQYVEW